MDNCDWEYKNCKNESVIVTPMHQDVLGPRLLGCVIVSGRNTAVTGTKILGGLKRLAKRCKRRRPTEQATQSSKGSEYKRRWNRAKHQLDRGVVEKQKGKGAPLTVLWGNPAKASVAKIQEKQAVDEPSHTPLAT